MKAIQAVVAVVAGVDVVVRIPDPIIAAYMSMGGS